MQDNNTFQEPPISSILSRKKALKIDKFFEHLTLYRVDEFAGGSASSFPYQKMTILMFDWLLLVSPVAFIYCIPGIKRPKSLYFTHLDNLWNQQAISAQQNPTHPHPFHPTPSHPENNFGEHIPGLHGVHHVVYR